MFMGHPQTILLRFALPVVQPRPAVETQHPLAVLPSCRIACRFAQGLRRFPGIPRGLDSHIARVWENARTLSGSAFTPAGKLFAQWPWFIAGFLYRAFRRSSVNSVAYRRNSTCFRMCRYLCLSGEGRKRRPWRVRVGGLIGLSLKRPLESPGRGRILAASSGTEKYGNPHFSITCRHRWMPLAWKGGF